MLPGEETNVSLDCSGLSTIHSTYSSSEQLFALRLCQGVRIRYRSHSVQFALDRQERILYMYNRTCTKSPVSITLNLRASRPGPHPRIQSRAPLGQL